MKQLWYFVIVRAIPLTNIHYIICTINVTTNKWSKFFLREIDSSKLFFGGFFTKKNSCTFIYIMKENNAYNSTLIIEINFQIHVIFRKT